MSNPMKYSAQAGWCENCMHWVEGVEQEVGQPLDGATCPECGVPAVISQKTRRARIHEELLINEEL